MTQQGREVQCNRSLYWYTQNSKSLSIVQNVSQQTDGLELVNLVLVVAEIGKNTSQLALVLRGDLVSGDSLVHGWWTTNKDLDILLWLRKDSLQQILVNESLLEARRILRWLVQNVEGAESLWESVLEVVKLMLKEDIFLSDIAENQSDLGLILWVVEDSASDLETWGDSSSTSDKSDVLVLVGLIWVFWHWALKLESLVWSHVVEVCGHWPVLVLLD